MKRAWPLSDEYHLNVDKFVGQVRRRDFSGKYFPHDDPEAVHVARERSLLSFKQVFVDRRQYTGAERIEAGGEGKR